MEWDLKGFRASRVRGGDGGRRDALPLVPGLSGRGCLSLQALDSGYLPSSSVRAAGAGSATFLHSSEAQVAILLGLEEPLRAGWSQGWKNWSSSPPPPIIMSLEF